MVTQQAGSLAGFDHSMFTHDGRAHEVFRAGTGPAVIVIHENGLLCWIRGHDQVIARPGRGGHMPPRSSMARATRASGERNPKAMRVRSRSFVFTLSTRAFDSPWL